ncbi:DUF134 domain-containing protein [Acetivibrio cellulolyticus]|uniref:DUF134 domain-containing protein n=1 Tax=Acetivibrio cellulolyticus TaxID=35830 RepID=UPI0001E2D14E|nr:DUF134 domain-containing protein [Acetivibrio cellulolyticus]
MSRPPKWRKVEFIPNIQYFVPLDSQTANIEENILRIEEVEAIRLKDVEKLEQEECAERMEVSRQTFQRILNTGREKIADSIINGKAIRIEGGNFTRNICPVKCLDCNKEWKESYENFEKIIKGDYSCPDCQSKKIVCQNTNGQKFCKRNCWRRGKTI